MRTPAQLIHGLGWATCIPYGYNYLTGEPISQCGSVSDQMPCVTGVPQFPGAGYCPVNMPGYPAEDLRGYPTGLEGLGDCGTSPCGFTDLFWQSADCTKYLACVAAPAVAAVNPPNLPTTPGGSIYTNPLYSAIPGSPTYTPSAGDIAAQAAGAAPGTPFASLTAAQQAAYLQAQGVGTNPDTPTSIFDSMPTWLPWAAGGFAVLLLLMSMGGRRR